MLNEEPYLFLNEPYIKRSGFMPASGIDKVVLLSKKKCG